MHPLPLLDTANPTADPCWPLYDDYNSAPGGPLTGKQQFGRDLHQKMNMEIAKFNFNQRLEDAILALEANPTDPEVIDDYNSFVCDEGGFQVYRAVQATCINIFVINNCPPVNSGIEPDRDGEKDLAVASSMEDPVMPPCLHLRYSPCTTTGPCCIERIELCYVDDPPIIGQEPYTHVSSHTFSTTDTVGTAACDTSGSKHHPIPPEVELGCFPYCDGELPETKVISPINLSLLPLKKEE